MSEPPFKIVASEACPPDVAILMPDSLTAAEKLEVWKRVLAGESPIDAAIAVVRRKCAIVRFRPTPRGDKP